MGGGSSKSKDPAVGATKRLVLKVAEDKEWTGTLPKFGKKPAKVANKTDELILSGCKLGPVAGATLGAALPLFHALKTLDVSNCNLQKIGTKALFKAISLLERSKLTKIWAPGNFDEAMKMPESVEVVCEALKSPAVKNLTSLNLGDNGIGPKGALKLAAALEESKLPLTELLFGDCQLGMTGGAAIGKAANHLKALQHLDLFNCNMGDKGVSTISELMTSVPLTSLSLQANAISWKGAVDVAKGLLALTAQLENLDLSSNAVGNESNSGCVALAETFTTSPPLKLAVLNLAENSLGDGDPTPLFEALKVLKSLAWLDLSSNHLRKEVGASLSASLSKLSELRILSLNDNDTLEEGAEPVIKCAAKLAKLKELHAGKVTLTNSGAKAAVMLLKENSSLMKLDLRGNLKLEKALFAELRTAAGSPERVLVSEEEEGIQLGDIKVGPLDARKMHYEYHGTKAFMK